MRKSTFFKSYFSYIFIFAFTLLLAVFYLQTFFFMLVVLELCLPVFSYFLSAYCFRHLKVSLVTRPSQTIKGSTAQVTLLLDNPTLIPFASAQAEFSFCSLLYHEEEAATHMLSLRSRYTNRLNFPVRLTKCGLYEARVTQLAGYDYLHLFRFKRDLDISAQLRVFPDSVPREGRHEALYSEGFDEFEESGKSGNVSSNVTDIREYRPGDRLQKIHWKLSSKIDKLMVKENEATSTNEFFLLLELFQPVEEDCGQEEALRNALDNAIEEAWALALELIRTGEIFVCAVYSTAKEDFVMSTIRSQTDLENAFAAFFYEPAYDTENLALDIYHRSGMKKGTLLHVTHKGVADVIE